jgi:arabinofuranosyltransferase
MRVKTLDKDRLAFAVVLAAYVAWALYYVHRTSVVSGGHRTYTLWDDAMISMRYARNLAEGHGLTWNPGERVMGFSNLGVTLSMVPIHWLPIDRTVTSLVFQLVCLGALLGSMAIVGQLTRCLFGDEAWPSRAAVLLFAGCAPLQVLGLQGTDVPFVTLLVLLMLLMVARAVRRGEGWPLGAWLVLAVGVVVRIDLAVLFGACILFSGERRAAVQGSAILAVTLAIVLGFSWAYYGDALPNTYYLKATGQPRGRMLLTALTQMGPVVTRLLPVLLVTVLGYRAFFRADKAVALVAKVAAVFVAYNVWVGGDWIPEYTSRFVTPALALLIVLFVGAAWRLVGNLGLRGEGESYRALSGERRVDVFFVASLIAIPCFATPEALSEWLVPSADTMHVRAKSESLALAEWLTKHSDPSTTVAVHWGGIQPYFSDRNAFDVLGKTDKHIAHLTVDRYEPGHSKWDWPYVVETLKPDLFDGETRGLAALPAFRQSYCEVKVPGEPQLTLYLRRESREKITPRPECATSW